MVVQLLYNSDNKKINFSIEKDRNLRTKNIIKNSYIDIKIEKMCLENEIYQTKRELIEIFENEMNIIYNNIFMAITTLREFY